MAVIALMAPVACASPATADPAPVARLVQVLKPFADARNLTEAAVARAFHTSLVRPDAVPRVFKSVDLPGAVHLDLLELSHLDSGVELDLFPGADCITRTDLETVLGSGAVSGAIPDDVGLVLTWRRAAVPSRTWPARIYDFSVVFQSQIRCATQIILRHTRSSSEPPGER